MARRVLTLVLKAGVAATLVLVTVAGPARADFGFERSFPVEPAVDPPWPTEGDIAVDAQRNLYLSWRQEVQKYDDSGALVARFRPEGQVDELVGISTVEVDDSRGIRYAGAPRDTLIHRFTLGGTELEPLLASAYEIAVDERDGSLHTLIGPGTFEKLSPSGDLLVRRGPAEGEAAWGGQLDMANGRLFDAAYNNLHELSPDTLELTRRVFGDGSAFYVNGSVAVGAESIWMEDQNPDFPVLREIGFDGVLRRMCELAPVPQPSQVSPSMRGESLAYHPDGTVYVFSGDQVEVFVENGEGSRCRDVADVEGQPRIGRLVLSRTALVAGRRLRLVLVADGLSLRARLSFFRHRRAGGRSLVGRRSVDLRSARQLLTFRGPRRGTRFKPGRYSLRVDLVEDGAVLDSATRRFRILR